MAKNDWRLPSCGANHQHHHFCPRKGAARGNTTAGPRNTKATWEASLLSNHSKGGTSCVSESLARLTRECLTILTQTLHVCHIYAYIILHGGGLGGQCRHIWHTWSVCLMSPKQRINRWIMQLEAVDICFPRELRHVMVISFSTTNRG